MPPLATRLLCTLLLPLTLLLASCGESEEHALARIATMAQTNPSGAQSEIVILWRSGTITLNGAINLAHDKVEKNQPGCLAMAQVTLGATSDLNAEVEKKGVNEFYWMRVGSLAGKSARIAYDAGDIPTARSLVLAGPPRWKNDNFWRQFPNHDALASYILHASGETREALNRLNGRPDLDPEVQRAVEEIQAAQRADAARAAAIAAEEAKRKKGK